MHPNPLVNIVYYELINNYNILIKSKLNNDNFNKQLEKVYLNELEFLETNI